MATTTTIVRTDDLDGTAGNEVQNVRFSVDDQHFEIDLTPEHHEELHEALKRFTAAGRRISAAAAPRRGRATAASTSATYDAKAVRAWAIANGQEVPARGRIPKVVLEAYAAPHNA